MGLYKKIMGAFLGIALILVISMVVAKIDIEKIDQLGDSVIEATENQSIMESLQKSNYTAMANIGRMILNNEKINIESDPKKCPVGQWYYKEHPEFTPEEKSLYDSMEAPHIKQHEIADKIVSLVESGNLDEAQLIYSSEYIKIVDELNGELLKFAQIQSEHAKLAKDQMAKEDVKIKTSFLIMMIISVIIALLIGFIMSKRLVDRIKNILYVVEKVARGDLREKIEVKSKDELGNLGNNINIMIDELALLIKNIKESSSKVSESSDTLRVSSEETGKAAEEISTTMTNLTKDTVESTEMIDKLESVVGGLESISEDVKDASANTLNVVEESTTIAKEGYTSLEQAISQLEIVNKTVEFASSAVKNLEKRSSEIANITSVIRGIASQTNLLALNASIEAARAGEHGKGFAVVSTEVKKLAEASGQAADDIVGLIEDIVSETQVTIKSMEFNEGEVKKQVELINSVGHVLKGMLEKSADSKEAAVVMDKASILLRSSIQEVMDSMNRIKSITEQNAAASQEVLAATEEQTATVQEMASSTVELHHLSNNLDELISKFEV